jgi:hypothetical protein
MPLTEEQLTRLEALERAATQGPWSVDTRDMAIARGGLQYGVQDYGVLRPNMCLVTKYGSDEDLALIAESRNLLSALIAALRASQAEARRLREVIDATWRETRATIAATDPKPAPEGT